MPQGKLRTIVARSVNALLKRATGNATTLDLLLRAGLDPEALDVTGDTVLHYAVREKIIAAVDVLLKCGADIQAVARRDGATPLHCAAVSGSAPVIALLLKAGGKMQADRYKNTPLHYARTREALEALLKAGSNLEAAGHYGHRPLHWAAAGGSVDAVQLLVAAGADVKATAREWGETPLHCAASGASVELIRVLVRAGADVEAVAEAAGRLSEWPRLLGVNKNNATQARHHYYIRSGPAGVIHPLVEGGTPLHVAALRGSVGVLESLLEAGADVHATAFGGGTALHYAARVCSVAKMNSLLHAGANAEARDDDGLTPLHSALLCSCAEGKGQQL